MSQCFPKPFQIFGGNISVKVDLSNYATKADIKNISSIDTSMDGLILQTFMVGFSGTSDTFQEEDQKMMKDKLIDGKNCKQV